MKRPTIADIAKRAGVAKSSVSFALNGQPGVSDATRRRILAIAEEMGWQPSPAARALSGGRTGVLGLMVNRPASTLGVEPFFMQLVSGIEAELSRRDLGVLLQMSDGADAQLAAYRRWWAQRRVDGVFVTELSVDDERIPLLKELGMPAIVMGGPHGLGGLPGLWNDDKAAVRKVVEYLAALGHRHIARVAGLPNLWHTRLREEAFDEVVGELGLTGTCENTDFTDDAGATATRGLLASSSPPTAIIYDNDIMAVAGLAVATEMGVPVPGRLSIVAWDDSMLCRVVHPQLTANRLDIAGYGAELARRLVSLVDGNAVDSGCYSPLRLVPRGSTGLAPTQ